jgi:hypothetical protein
MLDTITTAGPAGSDIRKLQANEDVPASTSSMLGYIAHRGCVGVVIGDEAHGIRTRGRLYDVYCFLRAHAAVFVAMTATPGYTHPKVSFALCNSSSTTPT